MSNYNIYFSPTGGTKKVADVLSGNIFAGNSEAPAESSYEEFDICREISPTELQENDVCIISVPSFGGRVPTVAVERLKKIHGNGAVAILNCVYGNRDWDDTLTELQDLLTAQGFRCAAAIAAVAEHSLFRQFATGRPDAEDMSDLVRFCRKIRAVMAQFTAKDYGKLRISGSHIAYKPYAGGPFKPTGNENCTGCGFCAEECPAGAIDKANPKEVNSDLCISCMRCVKVCPKQARSCDAALLKNVSEKMAPALSPRKSNFLFLPSEIGK